MCGYVHVRQAKEEGDVLHAYCIFRWMCAVYVNSWVYLKAQCVCRLHQQSRKRLVKVFSMLDVQFSVDVNKDELSQASLGLR